MPGIRQITLRVSKRRAMLLSEKKYPEGEINFYKQPCTSLFMTGWQKPMRAAILIFYP